MMVSIDQLQAQDNNAIRTTLYYHSLVKEKGASANLYMPVPLFWGLGYERYIHDRVSLCVGASTILFNSSEGYTSSGSVSLSYKAGLSLEYEVKYFFSDDRTGGYIASGLAYKSVREEGTLFSSFSSKPDWERKISLMPASLRIGHRGTDNSETVFFDFFIGVNYTFILSDPPKAAFLSGANVAAIPMSPVVFGMSSGYLF
jgi:hypothetical protein